MEKLRFDGLIAQSDAVRTRKISSSRFTLVHRVITGVLLITILSLWSPEVGGLFSRKPCQRHLTIEQRARKVLQETPLIDGHNDLMIFITARYQNHIYKEFAEKFENGGLPQHVDVPRLKEGMSGGAFWSAFWPCPQGGNGTDFSDEKYYEIVKATLGQLDLFHRLASQYPKYFTPTPSAISAIMAFNNGYFISPAAIEGLHQIGNSISTLRLFHQLGVRYATLTWNCHNKYADAALESGPGFVPRIAKPHWHGLSAAGRDLVKEMNRLGMLVDLSHVSADTMRDALVGKGGDKSWNGSLAPPIFSHSSAFAVCPHPRNVPDDVLHMVKQRGSLVMINFSPDFISCVPGEKPGDLPVLVPENATLAQVVKHIRYVGELIGYEHVGIGTDYDGIEKGPEGLEDVSKFPDLVAELLRQGVSDADASKIVGGNLLRVWADADRVAAEMKHVVPLEDDIERQWGAGMLPVAI